MALGFVCSGQAAGNKGQGSTYIKGMRVGVCTPLCLLPVDTERLCTQIVVRVCLLLFREVFSDTRPDGWVRKMMS
jgi:hypothetical protein